MNKWEAPGSRVPVRQHGTRLSVLHKQSQLASEPDSLQKQIPHSDPRSNAIYKQCVLPESAPGAKTMPYFFNANVTAFQR